MVKGTEPSADPQGPTRLSSPSFLRRELSWATIAPHGIPGSPESLKLWNREVGPKLTAVSCDRGGCKETVAGGMSGPDKGPYAFDLGTSDGPALRHSTRRMSAGLAVENFDRPLTGMDP